MYNCNIYYYILTILQFQKKRKNYVIHAPWEGGGRWGISCFLAELPGNTKEKVTCLPWGHSSSMTPLLASASLLKCHVPAILNLFWFPNGCSLPSTCCSLCLEHSSLTSSMAKFHSSYRGLRLDVTSYMKSTRLTSSQLGQEPLLDSRGHVGSHHHCSDDSGPVYH